ncbi:meta-pathway of phenol degradation family protein, partial [Neisseria gonorrhoeae]
MKNILLVFVSFVPLCVRTDLPLNIEDIMTDKGKWKLETSLTYLNSENSRSELAAPVYIQTGSASFIPVPTEIQENGSNTDMLAGTLGLRYGLTGNTDIYGSGSYLWHEERKLDGNG